MKFRLIIGVCGLVAGLIFGYVIGYIIYTPKINELNTQVSSQESKIMNLTQTVSAKESIINETEQEVSSLKIDNNRLQLSLDKTEDELANYKETVTVQKTQLADIQKSLNRVLAIEVTQNYQWDYGFSEWNWDLPITLNTYVEYYNRQRPQDFASYVDLAKDPQDDNYINYMIKKINEAAKSHSYSIDETLNFVIAFVQSLPYTVDIETTPFDEYPRYPIETLFNRGGDCEDTSILVAALLDNMGLDVALLCLKDASHMAVGVAISGAYGTYYEYNGKKYYYLETTGEGWTIGQIPPGIIERKAYVYPLRG